jgi:hypothetical protein
MFPLPLGWDPLPGGPPTPLVGIGWPLLLVGVLAVPACLAIVGIDRVRARRRTARLLDASATRPDAVIDLGRTTVPRMAAGGRR